MLAPRLTPRLTSSRVIAERGIASAPPVPGTPSRRTPPSIDWTVPRTSSLRSGGGSWRLASGNQTRTRIPGLTSSGNCADATPGNASSRRKKYLRIASSSFRQLEKTTFSVMQTFHDCADVERGRVERWHAADRRRGEEHRQLRAAEYDAVDSFFIAESKTDADHAAAGLLAQIATQHLPDVTLVNPRDLARVGCHAVDSISCQDGRVERSFHCKPRAEQADSLHPAPLRLFGGGFDDADEWNGRSSDQIVEHDVRCVGSHRAEVASSGRESSYGLEQIFDQLGTVVLDQTESIIDVEAIHHDVWRRSRIGAFPFFENAPVVVDR